MKSNSSSKATQSKATSVQSNRRPFGFRLKADGMKVSIPPTAVGPGSFFSGLHFRCRSSREILFSRPSHRSGAGDLLWIAFPQPGSRDMWFKHPSHGSGAGDLLRIAFPQPGSRVAWLSRPSHRSGAGDLLWIALPQPGSRDVHRPRALSIVHCPLSCPQSTVHRPFSTVHCPPSTVHCPPSIVHCPSSTVHRPLSTV